MPTVPSNNISDPAHVRMPDVRIAQPRTAQAMQPVIGAMGNRISAQAAKGSLQMKKAGYEADERSAMWEGIEKTSGIVMEGTDRIDRISQRRAEEEADAALTKFSAHMNMAINGYTDEKTNERVPGTFEAPYTPGDTEDDASGPSIATAKAEREWLDNEENAYARLSKRARGVFDERAAGLHSDLMVKAGRREFDQIMAFRAANNKAALEASRQSVASGAGDITPQGNAIWISSMNNAIRDRMRGELSQYRTDGWENPLDRAVWANDDVAAYASNLRGDLTKIYFADRVETLKAMAQVEDSDVKRDALLKTAEQYMQFNGAGGKPIFEDIAIAKNKMEVEGIRVDAVQRKESQILHHTAEAKRLFFNGLLNPEKFSREEYAGHIDAIPADRRTDAIAEAEEWGRKSLVATEKAQWESFKGQLRAEHAITMGGGLHKQANALISTFKTDEARQYARDTMFTGKNDVNDAEFRNMIRSRTAYINGERIPLNEEQLTKILIDGSGVLYNPDKIDEFRGLISAGRTVPVIHDRIFNYLESKLGNDQISEALTFDKELNKFFVNPKAVDANTAAGARARNVQAVNPESVLAVYSKSERIPYTTSDEGRKIELSDGQVNMRKRAGLSTQYQYHEEKIRLTRELVSEIVQAAYEYEMAPKLRDAGGERPKTTEEFMDELLDGPTAHLLENADMKEHIAAMAAQTGAMTDRYRTALWNWQPEE